MSKLVMDYKGYQGSIEVSIEDDCLHGKILHVEDLITYEADGAKQLEVAFREAVDDYLEFCKEEGREPNKPFKGSFNIRIGEDLHKEASMFATRVGVSLNDLIKESIKARLVRGKDDQIPTVVHNHTYRYEVQTIVQDENYGEEGLLWNLKRNEALQQQ